METSYYTLNAREIIVTGEAVAKVSGEPARQLVRVRRGMERAERNNVIDLAQWRAAREEEAGLEADETGGEDRRNAPAIGPRQEHPALLGSELLATLSVIGAMAMLILRCYFS